MEPLPLKVREVPCESADMCGNEAASVRGWHILATERQCFKSSHIKTIVAVSRGGGSRLSAGTVKDGL